MWKRRRLKRGFGERICSWVIVQCRSRCRFLDIVSWEVVPSQNLWIPSNFMIKLQTSGAWCVGYDYNCYFHSSLQLWSLLVQRKHKSGCKRHSFVEPHCYMIYDLFSSILKTASFSTFNYWQFLSRHFCTIFCSLTEIKGGSGKLRWLVYIQCFGHFVLKTSLNNDLDLLFCCMIALALTSF